MPEARNGKSLIRQIKKFNLENGSVESALVLIPLLALFLATLQIVATINLRNVGLAATQSQASLQSVHQIVDSEDELISLKSGSRFSRLRLLVVSKVSEIPSIFPGINKFLGDKKLVTKGTAVFEESEECHGGYLIC